MIQNNYSLLWDKSKVLTHDDMIPLIKAAQEGNKKAMNKLIECNLGLLFTVLCKNRFNEDNKEDLIQEGMMGLVRAIELFDVTKGTKFSTYATLWIEFRMRRWFHENIHFLNVSCKKMSRAFYFAGLTTKYTDEEIIADHNFTAEEIADCQEILRTAKPGSFHSPAKENENNDGEECYLEFEDCHSDFRETASAEMDVEKILCGLAAREKIIFLNLYIYGRSASETAKLVGISHQRLAQINNDIIKRLQAKYAH